MKKEKPILRFLKKETPSGTIYIIEVDGEKYRVSQTYWDFKRQQIEKRG